MPPTELVRRVIGIDCAVEDTKVGLAQGILVGERLEVQAATPGGKGRVLQQLEEWIDPQIPTLIAIDAPLGWPSALGKALASHQAGQPLRDEPDLLFRRYTDLEIKRRLRQTPLDVGADRIARTAHRALKLLAELSRRLNREVPLAWEPFDLSQGLCTIEVYPAATLVAHGIPIKGYKNKKKGGTERREILARLGKSLDFPANLNKQCESCVDALDAVVCLLAGADFLLGKAPPPSIPQMDLAQKEGWIWCSDRTDKN